MDRVKNISKSYEIAKEVYANLGVDTEKVLKNMAGIQVSLNCWQGDDVTGFEKGKDGLSDGGIMATGNYPGKARDGNELRQDVETAFSLIPGKQRLNLHAIYAETGDKAIERSELTGEHFKDWIAWAKNLDIGLDFNPTFFSHRMAASGLTLSSGEEKVRRFWVEHGKRSREIGAYMGKELGTPCINNLWIPDGSKDLPADRMGPRKILKESLDEIFAQKFDAEYLIDSVESKLFGIGSEAYVVGSHEFYMGYAAGKRDLIICLDMGHFHPTESIADKISSILTFSDGLLIHASRGVRWDSDHVALFNNDLVAAAQEVKRCDAFGRVYFALDFFDASINRITAWVTGMRAMQKCILYALLEPTHMLLKAEKEGNFGERLALMEEFKTLPFGSVWDMYCACQGVPVGADWISNVREYEKSVLINRR